MADAVTKTLAGVEPNGRFWMLVCSHPFSDFTVPFEQPAPSVRAYPHILELLVERMRFFGGGYPCQDAQLLVVLLGSLLLLKVGPASVQVIAITVELLLSIIIVFLLSTDTHYGRFRECCFVAAI
jgi:hypothetical protein